MDVAVEQSNAVNGGAAPVTTDRARGAHEGAAPDGAQPKVRFSPGAQVIGEIVGLLSQSLAHRHLADLEWLIGPPVALRQFRIFHDDTKPLAVALWASVSDEVEKELVAGRPRLRPNEWKSGENLWLIDLVAPTIPNGSEAAEGLVQDIASKVFQGRRFKMRMLDAKTGRPKIANLQAKIDAGTSN